MLDEVEVAASLDRDLLHQFFVEVGPDAHGGAAHTALAKLGGVVRQVLGARDAHVRKTVAEQYHPVEVIGLVLVVCYFLSAGEPSARQVGAAAAPNGTYFADYF